MRRAVPFSKYVQDQFLLKKRERLTVALDENV